MKKILFFMLMGILIGVGATGVAGHFGKGPLAGMLGKGTAEPEAPPPPPPREHKIINLGEVITPLVKNHAIESQIGMDIDIDVYADGLDKLNDMLPLIDHRVRMEMYDFLPSHADTHSTDNRQAVHDRVQWVIENAVGPNIVKEVTLRTFYSR